MPAVTTTVRVRYAETDRMGVVYYANYFVWFEVARTDLLRSLGWSYRQMEDEGVLLPVIEARCEYKRPARYDDEIAIRADGRARSPVRLEFDYVVTRAASGEVLATGLTAHAAVGTDGRPCRLPERIRKVMA
ncbi:MAG TPA: thioesterase family protein [Vicinamibacterales bacterium]|nr:thioesterase family protein [Vicinamibacterales bacterium]